MKPDVLFDYGKDKFRIYVGGALFYEGKNLDERVVLALLRFLGHKTETKFIN